MVLLLFGVQHELEEKLLMSPPVIACSGLAPGKVLVMANIATWYVQV